MSTYKEIFGKPIKVLTGDPAPTPITYTVTVADLVQETCTTLMEFKHLR